MENVKSLTLKIVATFQSSVICLANVQIWGKLNWSVDHKVKKEVESIWNALIKAKSIQDQVKPEDSENYKKDEKTSSLKRSLAAADPDSIPEEFLDALTCKRMCTKLSILGLKQSFFYSKIHWIGEILNTDDQSHLIHGFADN